MQRKATDEQILDALKRHKGSRAAAAAELGMVARAMSARLLRMRARGADIPASTYHTRGKSTLYGADGEVKLTWVKEDAGKATIEQLTDALRDACIDPLPKISAPPVATKRLLTVIPIGDHHVGMYAWAEEAGADYDIKIADRLLVSAMAHLIDIAPPCDTCLIANVGDYFHYDSHRAETPASHNALDADTRYAAMIRAGLKMMRVAIEHAAAKFRNVRVINSPGNHDPIGALWLSLALGMYYEKNPRVVIDQSPGKFAYYQHGKVMIAVTHGDSTKIEKLPGIMAADQPAMWGATQHRYGITGHTHHNRVMEFPGVRMESFRTLAARDAWATAAGYRSGRDMCALVFDADHGEVARHRFDASMLEAA